MNAPWKLTLAALLIAATATGAQAQGEAAAAKRSVEYGIDTKHSNVGFSVRHLGISKVRGSFGEFGGRVWADPETGKATRVQGTVQVASVDTGIEGRDNHLRNEDFFYAEKHPEMTLEADNIKWVGDRFSTTAKLTLRGVTHPVRVTGEFLGDATVTFGARQHRAGYSASFKIDRQKFGLTYNRVAEAVNVVGNEVTVDLEIQITRNLE